VIPVLNFIDMADPMKIASMIDLHPIIEKYNASDIGNMLKGKKRQPEWLLHMYSMIMNEYGSKIVEIFDAKKNDLWEEYRKYLQQVYDIRGRSKIICKWKCR
jgi:hypothetical protein